MRLADKLPDLNLFQIMVLCLLILNIVFSVATLTSAQEATDYADSAASAAEEAASASKHAAEEAEIAADAAKDAASDASVAASHCQ